MDSTEANAEADASSFSLFTHPAFQVFTIIGLAYVSYKIADFFQLIASVFVLPGTSLSTFGPKGTWAVVTGASDGLGKEYALQLAAKGFNLALVSRTQSKLEELAATLKGKYGVDTRVLAMDFAANRDADYDALASLAASLEDDGPGGLGLLVNNVGLSHDIPVPFLDTPRREMEDIVMVNCLATLHVTAAIAPILARRRQRSGAGKSLILTMASFGGLLPTPLLATYSGSKAFLQQWSAALGAELEPKGVVVQCVLSYLVVSAMSKVRRPTATIPSARAFVKSALAGIGKQGGAQGQAYTSTPYWSHALMHWGLQRLVGTTSWFVIDRNKKIHESIRKRALRKREREAKAQ